MILGAYRHARCLACRLLFQLAVSVIRRRRRARAALAPRPHQGRAVRRPGRRQRRARPARHHIRWTTIRPGRPRAAGSPLPRSATVRPIFIACVADGTGLQRLTDNPAYDDQAAFSPDEKQIVFVSSRADGYANLWLLDLASGKQRALTTGQGGDFRPAWSPDGQWIAFSSDRDSDLPDAKGRWERLHIASIFLIHPDGSGLKRLTAKDGNFCGSPKWSADGKSLIAYCMKGQATWENRVGNDPTANELVRIDMATGAVKPLAAGPGLKEAPFPLAGGEIGYLRRDGAEQGLYYAGGKRGPKGADIRVPSWSPDGGRVVYSRFSGRGPSEPVRVFSKDPKFELYSTSFLPSVSSTGRDRHHAV